MSIKQKFILYRYIIDHLIRNDLINIREISKQTNIPQTTLWRQLKNISKMQIETIIKLEDINLFNNEESKRILNHFNKGN